MPPWRAMASAGCQTRSAWAPHTSSAACAMDSGLVCVAGTVRDKNFRLLRLMHLRIGTSQGQGLVTATLRLPKHSNCRRPLNLPWDLTSHSRLPLEYPKLSCGHLNPSSVLVFTWRPVRVDGIPWSPSERPMLVDSCWSREFSATVIVELRLWAVTAARAGTVSLWVISLDSAAVPSRSVQFGLADLIALCLCPKEQKCLLTESFP